MLVFFHFGRMKGGVKEQKGNFGHPCEPLRLAGKAIEPFKMRFSHPKGRTLALSRKNVERSPKAAHGDDLQGRSIAKHPFFLQGRAEADHKKVGAAVIDLCDHPIVFRPRLFKIAILRAADAKAWILLAKVRFCL